MSDTRAIIAQLGARKHYQEPLLFNRWGVLETLYTDFYAGKIPMLSILSQSSILNKLPNLVKKAVDRYEPSLDNSKIIHFPSFGYQYAQKLKQAKGEAPSAVFVWANQEFNRRILQRGLGNGNVIYGFNGASLELFEYAKQKGIRCVLDQTLAERSLVHQLLLQEENIWQDWSNSPFTVSDADLSLVKREQQEQDLADHIICGSQFVKDSLIARGVDGNKITVVSLGRIKEGQSLQKFSQRKTPKERGDGLRILFAGEVGLRKGIPYLLQALKQLYGKIPFTCKAAGGINIKPERIAEYSDVCDFLGRVPRSQMAELYAWADVFVLPSICEGSAMVTYEALSWTLPVVTTHNAGSIIRNGMDGYIVPIRCSNSIANTLINIFHSSMMKFDINKFEYFHQLYKDNEQRLKSVIENKC